MKNKFNLSIFALMAMLFALPMNAQWTAPLPTPSLLGGDSLYYFYNPGAGRYFTAGNAWDTQASIGELGYKIRVSQLEEGIFTLEDSCEVPRIGAWKYIFIDTPTAAYTDMGWQGNNEFSLTYVGYFNYRIAGNGAVYNADNYPNSYFGWDGGANTIIYPLLDMNAEGSENYHINWQLIEPTNYFVHQSRIELYKALVNAEKNGVSTGVAGAIYLSDTATPSEIKEAAVLLTKQTTEHIFYGATGTTPVDVTTLIINPNFDTPGDVSGWVTTTGSAAQTTATNQDGDFTHPFYENWHWDTFTGKVTQQLNNIPSGVYKLRAALSANNNGPLYLIANHDKVMTTSEIPVFVELFTEVTTGSLEIGMMQDEAINNWICMDTYTLHYYGVDAEAYRIMLRIAIEQTDLNALMAKNWELLILRQY